MTLSECSHLLKLNYPMQFMFYEALNGVVKESQVDVYIRFRDLPKACSEPRHTSKMKRFVKYLTFTSFLQIYSYLLKKSLMENAQC